MKVSFSTLLLMAGICGVVVGHGIHEEKQVPLHEQEFVQDSEEELERKWSFEVSCVFRSFNFTTEEITRVMVTCFQS